MEFIKALSSSLIKNQSNNALFINGKHYTYGDLSLEVSKIRREIANKVDASQKHIGLVTYDDIYTYAAILAIWFEGKAYIPINPSTPVDRNTFVFQTTGIEFVIDKTPESAFLSHFKIINPVQIAESEINVIPNPTKKEDLAYILFTSGTTGKPKGVPINFLNVQAFIDAMDAEGDFTLNSTDRCLQMYEFTFDVSVHAMLTPLIAGACLYTIPKNEIKYLYIFKLIQEQKLTVLNMVPSIVNYLRPYFSEISAPFVRLSTFIGSALHDDVINEWQNSIPNALIYNYYGPTECTVYCGYYKCEKDSENKTKNGIISIGKPQKGVIYIIIDENKKILSSGEKGELCLAGDQLTPGYWKNKIKNEEAFFEAEYNNEVIKFYKTGDLCIQDKEGDVLYLGRIDNQVKLRGYRVELSEVEHHAKLKLEEKVNIVAVAVLNSLSNLELCLAIEGNQFETQKMLLHMRQVLPDYMVPGHIEFIKEFPHNTNGKIDRNAIKKYFKLK